MSESRSEGGEGMEQTLHQEDAEEEEDTQGEQEERGGIERSVIEEEEEQEDARVHNCVQIRFRHLVELASAYIKYKSKQKLKLKFNVKLIDEEPGNTNTK